MRRFLAAALLSSVALLGAETRAVPAAECYPHCDYNHYYGPSDFTYVRPGLYGYPRCGPRGECSPNLVYSTTGLPVRQCWVTETGIGVCAPVHYDRAQPRYRRVNERRR